MSNAAGRDPFQRDVRERIGRAVVGPVETVRNRATRIERTWYGSGVADAGEPSAQSIGRAALAHADALYNLARYMTGDASDAEDLVQETFVRALAAAARFDGRNLKAWLLKILRNTFIDGYRARKRQPTRAGVDDGEGPVDADLLRDDVELHQLRGRVAADIEAALMTLGDDARTVILLDLEGLTEVEVAEVLGCAVGTVKSRLSRARAALRRRLQEYAR